MMSPSGHRNGRNSAAVAHLLREFVRSHGLGELTGAEAGFIIERTPDTVRAPDAAFISSARLVNAPKRGFFPGAPDLAVEVLSPDDTVREVLAKVHAWLVAETVEVWIVDPERQSVTVHRSDAPVKMYSQDDSIPGGDLLPGFALSVRALFE